MPNRMRPVTIRSARTGDVPVIRKLIDANVDSGRLLSKATVTLYEDIQEFCVAELDAAELLVSGGLAVSGEPADSGGELPQHCELTARSGSATGGLTAGALTAGRVLAGCGAVHVLWEDLAEIRTVAVRDDCQGLGIGHAIVADLIERSRALGVARVFVLTFAVDFFASHGFIRIDGTPVAPEVYRELLRSYDEGVAEFLDLERVKPNVLGNVRMLMHLTDSEADASYAPRK
jgi:amino-acid N-acetyltransferase